jgi:transposase
MKKIIEVLRLKYAARLSHEKIARACGLSKGTVNNYVSATQAQGITWPLPDGVDETRLEALLFPTRQPSSRLVEPDYFQMHQALKRKGVTLQLLWAEYVAVHAERGYRYSQFCNRYRQWRDRQKRSLRQIHLAGEKLFIDYCGPTVSIVDRHTGGSGRRRSSSRCSAPPATPMPRRLTPNRCRTGSPRTNARWPSMAECRRC